MAGGKDNLTAFHASVEGIAGAKSKLSPDRTGESHLPFAVIRVCMARISYRARALLQLNVPPDLKNALNKRISSGGLVRFSGSQFPRKLLPKKAPGCRGDARAAQFHKQRLRDSLPALPCVTQRRTRKKAGPMTSAGRCQHISKKAIYRPIAAS